jgi:hypothetical protein
MFIAAKHVRKARRIVGADRRLKALSIIKKLKLVFMLNEFDFKRGNDWDHGKIARCCPEPPPTQGNPPSSDCCYETWEWELTQVNWKLKDITSELTHEQKHLAVATTRYNRLKLWYDELSSANELTFKICRQLEVIEAQLANICRNTCYTVKAVEILYCMVQEFYYIVDELQIKYDRIMNCIKCLNNAALTPTVGIGKVLTDYGTALTAVVATRKALVTLLMSAVDSSIKLEWELCDEYGYKKLINHWQEALHCGIPCKKHEDEADEVPLANAIVVGDAEESDEDAIFCLRPILSFPICNDHYYKEVRELYEIEKEQVRELTHTVNELSKKQLALTAAQQSLVKALKEVTPS